MFIEVNLRVLSSEPPINETRSECCSSQDLLILVWSMLYTYIKDWHPLMVFSEQSGVQYQAQGGKSLANQLGMYARIWPNSKFGFISETASLRALFCRYIVWLVFQACFKNTVFKYLELKRNAAIIDLWHLLTCIVQVTFQLFKSPIEQELHGMNKILNFSWRKKRARRRRKREEFY